MATTKLDRIAIGLSVLCFLQCLATPLLLILLPALAGTVLDGELFHRLLAFVIVPLSGVAFFLGCQRHRRWQVLVPAGLGLAVIVLAAILGYARLGVAGEMAMTVSGALLLAGAHVVNYRLCRNVTVCEDHGAGDRGPEAGER